MSYRLSRILRLTAVVTVVLLALSGRSIDAAFPGMNGKIGFSAVGSGWSLFTIDPDGNNLVEVFNNSGAFFFFSWSPDGKRLALATGPEPGGRDEIYTMNLDGSELTRLTFFDGTDEEPSWSPDGQKIVWQRECDIWVMNADGTEQQNLTQTGGVCAPLASQEFHPKWSPNGAKISFETYRTQPGGIQIFTMNPDGSEATNISGRSGSQADWSPDSSKIVFESAGIYVMDANGANQTRITTPSANVSSPVWSPDGTKIAFVDRSGIRGIYTMNPDGADVRLVLQTNAFQLDWQPIVDPPIVPPTIESLVAARDVLWPPTGKMVPNSVTVSATGSPAPICQISSVASNESPTVPGPEWVVTGPLTLNLQADRAGSGQGRIYTITVACTNEGGTASKTLTVTVPHDRRR